MKYNFQELVDVAKLQRLTDQLYAAASIPCSVITMDGEILTGSGWQRICTDFHRCHPETQKDCIESDTKLRRELRSGRSYVVYRCPRGLVDASSPIVIAGKHMANVFAGQVLFNPPGEEEIQFFKAQARRFGFDEVRYMAALREIPIFPESKFRSALAFLSEFAGLIAEMGLVRRNELEALEVTRNNEVTLNEAQKIARIGSFVWDLQTDTLDWSDHMFAIAGVDAKTFCGNLRETVDEMIHPEDRISVHREVAAMVSARRTWPMEFRLVRPDGEECWLRSGSRFVFDQEGKPIQCIGVHQDITERRLAEEALRRSEEKYRELVENLNDVVYSVDREGIITYVSPSVTSVLGFEPSEIVGYHFRALVHAEDLDTVLRAFNDILQGRLYASEYRIQTKEGDYRWVRTSSRPTRKGNTVVGLHGVLTDITEQKRVQDRLSRREKELRRTLYATTDGIWEWDFTTDRLFFSPKYYTMLGYDPDEFPASYENWVELIHPDDRNKAISVAEEYLRTKPETYENEFRLRTKTGNYRWIRASARVAEHDENGNAVCMIGNHEDITDQKQAQEEMARLERQFQESRRLDALATLAGGLAHDFNNALSVITTNVELLKMAHDHKEEIMECLYPVLESTKRMGHLTNQLMAYAQGGKYQTRNVSVNRLIEDTLPSILHHDDQRIRLEKKLTGDMPPIYADLTQMQMIVSSIITNAKEAIADSGRIRIRTGVAEVNEDYAKQRPGLRPGEYVYVCIEDDGSGMDEEGRGRIYEPFFSTKCQGRGLGMAATYGIVKNHDGWIDVDSKLGKGTSVFVYLPVSSVLEEPAQERKEGLSFGKGNVLLIEDEKPIMKAMKNALEVLGYNVKVAGTGREGVRAVESADGDIDMVILDIGLPDMPGDSVYREIVAAQSTLKVLICSGYALSDVTQRILDEGAHGFVQKPFSLADFSSKVKEVFESESQIDKVKKRAVKRI